METFSKIAGGVLIVCLALAIVIASVALLLHSQPAPQIHVYPKDGSTFVLPDPFSPFAPQPAPRPSYPSMPYRPGSNGSSGNVDIGVKGDAKGDVKGK